MLGAHAMSSTVSGAGSYADPATSTLPGGSVYSASLTALDIACAPSTSSVVAPRSIDASVYRPMSAVGVRPPKSSVPIDVVELSSGPAPPTRVDMGQQRLGRPTSVDVASYPGLPSASVDAARRPHTLSMGVDVV